MNPETEKNVNEAIDWLQKTGGSIQDFAVEQAPLYCREVIQWELWSGAVSCASGIVFAAIGVKLLRVAKKWSKEDAAKKAEAAKQGCYHSTSDAYIVPLLAGLIALLISVLVLCESTPAVIKVVVAPRLVIVEHLRSLR